MNIAVVPVLLDPATSHHDAIDEQKQYLARIYGLWHLGTFSEQWYGWNFQEWGTNGIQLNHVEQLYEVDLSPLENR